MTIEDARTDVDFVDQTTYDLTVFVKDSGGYLIADVTVEISGDNGQAEGQTNEDEGKYVVTLNPGEYTVTVQGGMPEGETEEKAAEVDLTGGDASVTMIIPSKIELSLSPSPKLFDVSDEFLEQFGLKPEDNPEGYMYYYPPNPRTHTYTITATSNGHAVEDFTLFVTDDVSMMTEDAAVEEEVFVTGEEGEYIIVGGLPKQTDDSPPLATPKRITFRAEQDGWKVRFTGGILSPRAKRTGARILSQTAINPPRVETN